MTELSLKLRNVARYARDVAANVPLYEALGFTVERTAGDLVAMRHHDGLHLVLHRWDERPTTMLDTAIGFTLAGDADDVKAYLTAAGWSLLRAPHEGDVGYFLIFGDLDGNPVNLVGKPMRAAPPAGSVRLVLKDGKAQAIAETGN
jgi:catechol 2,3-dioxygenase-like lactoylglutathione lyase family enzyme